MRVLVAGAGGFIGGHLVAELIKQGYEVVAADLKPEKDWYQVHPNVDNFSLDLSLKTECDRVTKNVHWVFNLAADMGGMGFIESNKAKCMLSSLINTHLLMSSLENKVKRFFYASSACVYPSWLQKETSESVYLKESDAYPADPEDGYGWEKLFSERMCRHFSEDFGLEVRIGRYHNVYGPFGTYDGGREKAPAAACRKIISAGASDKSEVEIWGDGQQIRTFTYIDDCIKGTLLLMKSEFSEPLNIGSSEVVTINDLYKFVQEISGNEQIHYKYNLDAPKGVRGRASENSLSQKILGWAPDTSLRAGLKPTFLWIKNEMAKK
jgi:nucleoside-diphosphate-sugar epimerase